MRLLWLVVVAIALSETLSSSSSFLLAFQWVSHAVCSCPQVFVTVHPRSKSLFGGTLGANVVRLSMKSKVTGIGLYYIVGQSDVLEKRWLQSSFHGAVQFHRMQSKCSKLDKQLGDLSDERSKLEKSIREIEASSPSMSEDRSSELSSSLFASRLVGNGFHSLPVADTCAVGNGSGHGFM